MSEMYDSHEQATLLLLLLDRNGVPNPDLKKKYGIKFPATSRDKLVKDGLIESTKVGIRNVHKITEAGIDWCARELGAIETPLRSSPLAKMIFELARNLPDFLQWHDTDFADVLDRGSVEKAIRDAYQDLKSQDWVRLAKIRPQTEGIDRKTVDDVLLTMNKANRAALAPDSNRKVLTDEDHRAAIRIGSEDKHLLAIEES
ncbi:hypothetical protein [Kutzneria sp. NPDC052558]|uniref:hypothetical protein n=1 Tax=Kutzneria sp. NPDC052558 TaxID=3364121 RepID=UPI0037CBD167